MTWILAIGWEEVFVWLFFFGRSGPASGEITEISSFKFSGSWHDPKRHDAHKKVLFMVADRLVISQSIVVSHRKNALISVEISLTSLSYFFCIS